MKIVEGNLAFSFEDDKWSDLIKFDSKSKNPDYEKIEKVDGTKAVDIIGVLNNETVVFVEVKDCRGKWIENKAKIASGQLDTEIAQKVKDSLACIIGGCRNSTNLKESWLRIGKLLVNARSKIKVILWHEQEPRAKLSKRDKAKLSTRIKFLKRKLLWLTTHTMIYDLNSKTQQLHFKVSSLKFNGNG